MSIVRRRAVEIVLGYLCVYDSKHSRHTSYCYSVRKLHWEPSIHKKASAY